MTMTNLSLQLTDSSDLPNALAWLDGHFADAGADASVSADLKVVLDEQVANVFNHGAPAGGDVELELELEIRTGHVLVRFIDNGVPFDPLAQPIDTDFGDIEERPIGGLGVLLIRELTDRQHYRRLGDRNILELTRTFSTRT
ncbi:MULTISPECIES: ATP-binding protein [Marinobacter]|uniref:ATP-binding protein n=1 Tax=Marinobacter TaxID=2742 RepID=UPI000DAE74A2|nr:MULTISPECIES: ATP-binding protein [Marinobacter]